MRSEVEDDKTHIESFEVASRNSIEALLSGCVPHM